MSFWQRWTSRAPGGRITVENSWGLGVAIPNRIPKTNTSGVSFVETTYRHLHARRATYQVYRAPDRDQAITYLQSRPVREAFYYLEVETPDGTFGRDIRGVYFVASGADCR